MPPRPPTSTLFPYTTLFRSVVEEVAQGRPEGPPAVRAGALDDPRDDLILPLHVHPRYRLRRLREPEVEVELVAERSEEHTSELQSQSNLVCRLLLEKKKKIT